MIAISTLTYDLSGHVALFDASNSIYPRLERRVSRTASLDGNSSINDQGYSDGDRIYTFRFDRISDANIAALEYIIKTYSTVRLSTRDGAFLGVMSNLDISVRPVELTFLVKERVS